MSADKKAIGARLRALREEPLSPTGKARYSREKWAILLRKAAGPLADDMPSVRSLADMIKQWERGVHIPGPVYRPLYARVSDMSEVEIFGPDRPPSTAPPASRPDSLNGGSVDDHERLILAARNPARLDSAVVDSLAATLASQRRIEDVIGSRAVLDAATSHLALILRMLKEARCPLADKLAATASEASQFAGWLHTATGAHDAASPLYDQALRLGLQARDDDLAATALSMRGHLAWASGDYADMANLSQAAADLATAAGTRTVATQQRGRALALLGDRPGALRAIGEAEEMLTAGADRDDPDGLYFYGAEILTMQRGLIMAYLAETPAEYSAAAEVITAAIQALPPEIGNSEWIAWYRVQAAAARGAAGDPEESVAGLRTALQVLATTGGMKTLGDVERVQRALAEKWPDRSDVVELGEALR